MAKKKSLRGPKKITGEVMYFSEGRLVAVKGRSSKPVVSPLILTPNAPKGQPRRKINYRKLLKQLNELQVSSGTASFAPPATVHWSYSPYESRSIKQLVRSGVRRLKTKLNDLLEKLT